MMMMMMNEWMNEWMNERMNEIMMHERLCLTTFPNIDWEGLKIQSVVEIFLTKEVFQIVVGHSSVLKIYSQSKLNLGR